MMLAAVALQVAMRLMLGTSILGEMLTCLLSTRSIGLIRLPTQVICLARLLQGATRRQIQDNQMVTLSHPLDYLLNL